MATLHTLVPISVLLLLPAAHGLRLHEADRPSPSGEYGVPEHSIAKIQSRPTALKGYEKSKERPQMSAENCQAITEKLRTRKDTALAGRLFQIACENRYQCPDKLPDMSEGCLVASKTRHLEAMFATIGRPNPCAFSTLFYNSWFSSSECPTAPVAKSSNSTTSYSGYTYAACAKGGFATSDEKCAGVELIGDRAHGLVDVYAADAVLGLPESWEKSMNEYRNWHQSKNATGHHKKDENHKSVASISADIVPKNPPLRIKFYSCPISAKSEKPPTSWRDASAISKANLSSLVAKQVSALQQGFDGKLTCKHRVYDPASSDTGLHFLPYEGGDIEFLETALCGDCEQFYHEIWAWYMEPERGTVKVLLCKVRSLLGVSAFPWDEYRGTMFDYRTLPGGGMHNYDMGRTMIHEFGHYFGLYHTFQSGCHEKGDKVSDTNMEASPFFGCPDEDSPPSTCGDTGVDPVHNFMDYSDDRCMCGFTPNQAERLLEHARHSVDYPD